MKSPNYVLIVWKNAILMNDFKIVIVFIVELFEHRSCEFLPKVKYYNSLKNNIPVAITNTGVVCKLRGIVKHTKVYFTKKQNLLSYNCNYEVTS